MPCIGFGCYTGCTCIGACPIRSRLLRLLSHVTSEADFSLNEPADHGCHCLEGYFVFLLQCCHVGREFGAGEVLHEVLSQRAHN